MKFSRFVRQLVCAAMILPGFTIATGTETYEAVGNIHTPNIIYRDKTYDIYDTDDMEQGLDRSVNATFQLHNDITLYVNSLDGGILHDYAWTERHLYDRINGSYLSAGSSLYSLTFDGRIYDEETGQYSTDISVGQVMNWGRAEFSNLDSVNFTNITNSKCDENISVKVFSINLLAGGVLGANDSLIKSNPGAKPGVLFTDNKSITFSNIKADLQGEGSGFSNVTALGGAIFTFKGTTEFSFNDGDITFENIQIYSNTDGDIEIVNKMGAFEGSGGAIFSNGLTMSNNDGNIIFNNVGVLQEDNDRRLSSGLMKASLTSGGAIYMVGEGSISNNSGDVQFTNCYVNGGNSAWGGAVYLGALPSSIKDFFTLSPGGALQINNNRNVIFNDNSAKLEGMANDIAGLTRAHGGALNIGGGYSVEIADNRGKISFERNSAELVLNDSNRMHSNYQADGGAIYLGFGVFSSMLQCAVLSIDRNKQGVSIADNFATGRGGAIFGDQYAIISISANSGTVEFLNNETKENGGGAIYLAGDAALAIQNNSEVIFDGNKAGTNPRSVAGNGNHDLAGGAIHLNKRDTGDRGGASVNINGNTFLTFSNNSASGHGGAIYGREETSIDISGNYSVVFEGNSADGKGAAIYTEGNLSIKNNGNVTFAGHDGHAIYMTKDAGSSNEPHMEITAGGNQVLFDDDSIYAESTDSNKLNVALNRVNGGEFIFKGSQSGITVRNGNISVGSGSLILQDGATLTADSLYLQGSWDTPLILKNNNTSATNLVEAAINMSSGTIQAQGTNNVISQELNLTRGSTLSLFVDNINLSTVTQNDNNGLIANGPAVLTLSEGLNLQDGVWNLSVNINSKLTQNGGVYALLELGSGNAFDMDKWNGTNVKLTGDVIMADLRWNQEGTKLYYLHAEVGHAGDKVWTNKAGSGVWDFQAKNWKLANQNIDGIQFVNGYGAMFTDECTDPSSVIITTEVMPTNILVDASRDYTFEDGGGYIRNGGLTKKGTGTLTLALDNLFTERIDIEKGKVVVRASAAFGSAEVFLHTGATLRLENNSLIALSGNNQFLRGSIEVEKGSQLILEGKTNYFFDLSSEKMTIDGTMELKGTNVKYGENSYKNILSGSGTVLVSGQDVEFYFGQTETDSAISIRIEGKNDNLVQFNDGGYHGTGTLAALGADNKFIMDGQAVFYDGGRLELATGDSAYTNTGGCIQASAVIMEAGTTLQAIGPGNVIELPDFSVLKPSNTLIMHGNSTLDLTLSTNENATNAVLTVKGIPYLGVAPDDYTKTDSNPLTLKVTIDTERNPLVAGNSYLLMSVNPDGKGMIVTDDNWNQNLIRVTGDAIFEDLKWVDGDADNGYHQLVFTTPYDTVIWRDYMKDGIWNVDDRANWNAMTGIYSTAEFLNNYHVRFTDSCERNDDVRITEEVIPASMLVSADRDYTFVSGAEGGQISGDSTLTKQGRGKLTLALDNSFSGGILLKEGTLQLHSDRAHGLGSLTTHAGSSLVVGNWAKVSLSNGFSIHSDVEVDAGAELKLSSSSGDTVYRAPMTTVNGKLTFTEHGYEAATETLRGCGTVAFSSSATENDLQITRNDGFSGSLILEGAHNSVSILQGGYNGKGQFYIGDNCSITFGGESTDDAVTFAAGSVVSMMGSATLNVGAGSTFSQGSTLELTDNNNRIIVGASSEISFDNACVLDFTLSNQNLLSATGTNDAALFVSAAPTFGSSSSGTPLTFNVNLNGDDIRPESTYVLMAVSDTTVDYWTADNWNSELILVTGAVNFDDLYWVNSGDSCKLVFYAEGQSLIWDNASGSGVWNIQQDRNWYTQAGIQHLAFSDNKNVTFNDDYTGDGHVCITDDVSPKYVLVSAERDYTFTDGGGKITGTATLLKKGSGTLSLELANDFSGGVEIEEGTLNVQCDHAWGSGDIEISKSGTLSFGSDFRSNDTPLVLKGTGTVQLLATDDVQRTVLVKNTNDFAGTFRVTGIESKIAIDTLASDSWTQQSTGHVYAAHGGRFSTGEAENVTLYGTVELFDGGQMDTSYAHTTVSGATITASGNDSLFATTSLTLDNATFNLTFDERNAVNVIGSHSDSQFILAISGDVLWGNQLTINLTCGDASDRYYAILNLENMYSDTHIQEIRDYWKSGNVTINGEEQGHLFWVGSKLYYGYDQEFNSTDRIWNNSTGSQEWNFVSRNWESDSIRPINILYRDNILLEDHSAVNVRFDGDAQGEVLITETVIPGTILVTEGDYIFADGGGEIAGEASLVKQGSGTLTMALNNSFSGGVSLEEGTLKVTRGNALGSGKLTTAKDTLLHITVCSNVQLAAEGTSIEGKVQIDQGASLTFQGSAGSQENISELRGAGKLVVNADDAAYEVATSRDFKGDISVTGSNTSVALLHTPSKTSDSDYFVSGSGVELQLLDEEKGYPYAQRFTLTMEQGGSIQVAHGACFTTDGLVIQDGATLIAGVPQLPRLDDGVDRSFTNEFLKTVTLDVSSLSLYAGATIEQYGTVFSLDDASLHLYGAGNITILTDLNPIINEGMRDFLLFENVYDINDHTQSLLQFVVSGYEGYSTELVTMDNGLGSFDVYVRVIPEPATATLSLLALAALAARRRRS